MVEDGVMRWSKLSEDWRNMFGDDFELCHFPGVLDIDSFWYYDDGLSPSLYSFMVVSLILVVI
jgi:hypothetical protein